MRRLIVMFLAFSAAAPAALLAQTSNAARWLAEEALQENCGGGGRFEPGGLIEADLTGDGENDLLIYTAAIACDDGRYPATCGAAYCDAEFYVREGDLLVHKGGVLTLCAELAPGTPPGIRLCNKDTGPYVVRWNGQSFE